MAPKSTIPPKKAPNHKMTFTPIGGIAALTDIANRKPDGLDKIKDPELRKIVAQVFRIAAQMAKKDIATWFSARQAAIQVMFPNRTQLYDLYSYPLEIDAHMRFLMRKVALFIKSANFQITDENGKVDDALMAIFNKHWFRKYMVHYAMADFQGFTLMECESVDPATGDIVFNEVPRKHVVPEKGAWIQFQSTNAYIPYRSTPAMDWLIEIGEPFNLGWLDVCAPLLLYKRNAMVCWAEFCERFGLPLPVGKTNVHDKEAVDKISNGLSTLNKKSWAVIDLADEIEFTESAKTDAYMVFDANIERCNNEMSKLVLLNIMSADVGKNGSYAQAKEHGDMEDQAKEEKKKDFESHVNEVLFPFVQKHGIATLGRKFAYDKTFSVSNDEFLQDMWGFETFEIPFDYFAKKYGWPITGVKQKPEPAPTDPAVMPETEKTKVKPDMKALIKLFKQNHFTRSMQMHDEIRELYTHSHD